MSKNNLNRILFRIGHYLRHLIMAKNARDIHSPFIFGVYNEVLKDRRHFYAFDEIEGLQERLKSSDESILVTDFGEGGSKQRQYETTIGRLVLHTKRPQKYARLFFRIVSFLKARNILELGTSLGFTTAYMASARKDARVLSIEGCPNISKSALKNFEILALDNIELQTGRFEDILPAILKEKATFDLIFIDGHHNEKATMKYFEQILPHLTAHSVLMVDDIHWSPGMHRAWKQILKHPDCTLSVDLYYFGLVFNRPNQAREHFILRI